MKVYTLLAYVRTDDWTDHVTLGSFSTQAAAQDAFAAWVTGDGPRRLDPSAVTWDDGYTHYGYHVIVCDLDHWTADEAIVASEDLERVYPPDEDE